MSDVFDRVADVYDQTVPFFAHFGHGLAEYAGVASAARVLDLACGRGAVGAAARAKSGGGAFVAGVDASAAMLRGIMSGAAPVAAVRADATRLPFAGGAFDVAVCGFAMHIMPDAAAALAETYRVLRPGGVLAYSVPGPVDDGGRWDFYRQLIDAYTPLADPIRLPTGPHRPLTDIAVETGFVGLEQTLDQIRVPVAGPDGFWDWHQSHGARSFVDALPAEHQERFRRNVYDGVQALTDADGRVVLHRGAVYTRASKPTTMDGLA